MTPRPTKIVLVATLALTAAAFGSVVAAQLDGTLDTADLAPVLWLLTALFAVRVAGQVLVALRSPSWLPPMHDWNLVPYRLLLPVQLVILAVMTWIDASFSASSGPPVERADVLGSALIAFSAVYAGAMVVRYVVRMRRRPEERWFGGTIPIVFHLVLATYLYALGSFHVSS
ncbi:MAG TPA: hypothetical protein VFR38_14495 [Gaiellaceae bacterium]|nr:hypothetical protein [Gaiellaceae bacterium]